ncbi:MAG: 4-hydroxy-tetrahydrodipicolinate reductase [Clostridia bacterium]
MTTIALSGCNGRMGRVITDLCEKRDSIKIIAGFDKFYQKNGEFPVFADPNEFTGHVDAIIDFSNISALDNLLDYALKTKTPLVLCTTGYAEEDILKIEKVSKEIPIFKSGNMSLGINLIMDLLKKSANVLGENYDVEVIEKHHNQKLDAPSGTALMLADSVKENLPYDAHYVYDRSQKMEKRDSREIGISAIRGGTIVGEHSVIFAGHDEVIEIKHSALSREVFANGAIDASVFISTCTKPKIYDMTDVINSKN